MAQNSIGEREMNNGTILRTILVIATCFNTALMATDVAQFHNPTVNLIYKILSVVANFIIVFCATYFNNDFTVEGDTGTRITREMKALKGHEWETVEEPADSYTDEDYEEYGGESDGEE